MTERSFVVARGEGRDREYFAGIQRGMFIATSKVIFNALAFKTEAKAKKWAKVLASNGLTGFAPSEITSGASDNLNATGE